MDVGADGAAAATAEAAAAAAGGGAAAMKDANGYMRDGTKSSTLKLRVELVL